VRASEDSSHGFPASLVVTVPPLGFILLKIDPQS
jgi:hypothetical protein